MPRVDLSRTPLWLRVSDVTHDAIIIGAGPAGAAAAIELSRQGRQVAVVEKAAFPRRKVCGEFMSATTVPVLRRLGAEAAWHERAGPEVRRVALFAGEQVVDAPMPARHGYGRALGRDVLDPLLLDIARRQGADVFQPWRAASLSRDGHGQALTLVSEIGETKTLSAAVVIAAHGSWERGSLPSNLDRIKSASDMLGFKAHFRRASLAAGTMPLLAFPGGYGGMVWADNQRLSLSCCIRRDVLASLRHRHPGTTAAEALHAHISASSRGVREVLAGSHLLGPWLATGPIRPGFRSRYADDIFRVGNVAGEAHPVIAEGISMAIQSASLLADALARVDIEDPAARIAAGSRYAAVWSRQFSLRIHAARAIAALAMHPAALAVPVCALPRLLTVGARISGKARLSPQH